MSSAAVNSASLPKADPSSPRHRLLITGGSGFIGTNLVEHFAISGTEFINLDITCNHSPVLASAWRDCDVMDEQAVERLFREFRPTHVVHLAARTDCRGRRLNDYLQNTEGTRNVLKAAVGTKSVRRVVLASTQFVCQPGHIPTHAEDYRPHTAYGESKIVMERIVRAMDPPFTWTIVRPTTIWGPWLIRHRRQVFPALRWGLYMHPGKSPVMRTWGYVGNVVHQLLRILELPDEIVHRQVFYLGDEPIDLREWVNAFSRRLRGREVRIAPRAVVRGLAVIGDLLAVAGFDPPLTSSRYRSMTRDYLCPMEETFRVLGPSPFTMTEGVEATMRWLRESSRQTKGLAKQAESVSWAGTSSKSAN